MLIIELVIQDEDKICHYCRSDRIPIKLVRSACEKYFSLIEKDGKANYKILTEMEDVSGLLTCIICKPRFEKLRAAKIVSQSLK